MAVKYGQLNSGILDGEYTLCMYDDASGGVIDLDEILKQEGLNRGIFDLCAVIYIYNSSAGLMVEIDPNRASQILRSYEVEV